jgi:VWFA-related protein
MCNRFQPMRSAAILLLMVWPALAQFKSTVPLVVAPTTVTDGKGRFIDGLTEHELIVYDNNVPQAIQVDFEFHPISLVVLVEANTASAAIVDKLGGSGSLFTDLLSAEAGETAVVAFSDSVRLIQNFTGDSNQVSHALRNLRSQGDGCALLDGLAEALRMLGTRDPGRRKIVLVVAERRDRSSKVQLPNLLRDNQLSNTAVYG